MWLRGLPIFSLPFTRSQRSTLRWLCKKISASIETPLCTRKMEKRRKFHSFVACWKLMAVVLNLVLFLGVENCLKNCLAKLFGKLEKKSFRKWEEIFLAQLEFSHKTQVENHWLKTLSLILSHVLWLEICSCIFRTTKAQSPGLSFRHFSPPIYMCLKIAPWKDINRF